MPLLARNVSLGSQVPTEWAVRHYACLRLTTFSIPRAIRSKIHKMPQCSPCGKNPYSLLQP